MAQGAKAGRRRTVVGVALVVGAGLGMIVGLLVGEGSLVIGLVAGAAVGALVGAVWDGYRSGR